MKKFEYVCFHPAMGRLYEESQFGLKVMILGESHYRWIGLPKDRSQTTKEAIKGRHVHRFWKRIASLFHGKEEDFWDHVLFYNYVQHLVPTPRERPTRKMWRSTETKEGFKEILRLYQPELILVIGKTTWRRMVGSDDYLPEQPPIKEGRFPLTYAKFNHGLESSERFAYWYPTAKGRFALAAPIFHPRFHGFTDPATKQLVDNLVKNKWKIPIERTRSNSLVDVGTGVTTIAS